MNDAQLRDLFQERLVTVYNMKEVSFLRTVDNTKYLDSYLNVLYTGFLLGYNVCSMKATNDNSN